MLNIILIIGDAVVLKLHKSSIYCNALMHTHAIMYCRNLSPKTIEIKHFAIGISDRCKEHYFNSLLEFLPSYFVERLGCFSKGVSDAL